jgi:hypothetical protein
MSSSNSVSKLQAPGQVAQVDSEAATLKDDRPSGEEETKASVEDGKEEEDVLIVDWDGPDDPANPKKCVESFNILRRRKWAATAIVSMFTFISPVSSSMIAPASLQVAKEFGVHSTVTIALMTSIFVLAYGASWRFDDTNLDINRSS